jgi:putative hemolysin
MIDVQKVLTDKFPKLKTYPKIVTYPLFGFFRFLFHEKGVNEFLKNNVDKYGFDFVDAVLDFFNFNYTYLNKQKENIPPKGRVVVIANHPLGALDALALLKMISEVRQDVKIVANDMLYSLEQLRSLLLGVDNLGNSNSKESIKKIYEALNDDKAVVFFPSGEVSRARPSGLRDTAWQRGFLKVANKTSSPILPIYIKAKNSFLFYFTSFLNKKLAALLLVREMFAQKNKKADFKIGEIIPYESLQLKSLDDKTKVKLLRKHLYRVARNRPTVFTTQKAIAHPIDRQLLKKELSSCELLGSTSDNKKIYLYEYAKDSNIIKELGRLREYTFRKVGEGTGKTTDRDSYDVYYKHIVLWDEEELEIVGSYRIGESANIIENIGAKGLYTTELFNFTDEFNKYLNDSVELGRSFVQPKYWGTKALDYLWFGVGAYLSKNKHIKYLFGPVSISGAYPKLAKDTLVQFYSHYFGEENVVICKTPYTIDNAAKEEFLQSFKFESYKDDFKDLKQKLSCLNIAVPTLYKQYSDLCEDGGVKFLGFNIDKDFNDCIDGFIVVEVDKMKENKKQRYILSHSS